MPICIICGAPAALLDPRRGDPVCLTHVSPLNAPDRDRMESILRELGAGESGPARCPVCKEFITIAGERFCGPVCAARWENEQQPK